MDIFTAIFFLALVVEMVIRAPLNKKRKQEKMSERRVTNQEMTILGVVILGVALYVFWRAHADLGLNWSPTLEIREKHELITRGIYSVIRHPMYASQWLLAIAQPFLLQNWIAGFLNLLLFIPFYVFRVKAEEQLMIEQFGDQYRTYMQKVGAVFPKL
jgi:protein-S-isoprenylcysteine O-methyltransferase Ste14